MSSTLHTLQELPTIHSLLKAGIHRLHVQPQVLLDNEDVSHFFSSATNAGISGIAFSMHTSQGLQEAVLHSLEIDMEVGLDGN